MPLSADKDTFNLPNERGSTAPRMSLVVSLVPPMAAVIALGYNRSTNDLPGTGTKFSPMVRPWMLSGATVHAITAVSTFSVANSVSTVFTGREVSSCHSPLACRSAVTVKWNGMGLPTW